MFSTDFIFRQQENLVGNQKCQAGFRSLCNKILLMIADFPIDISIRLAELKYFLLLPDFANSLPCWLSQQNLGFIVSDLMYIEK